MRTPGPSSATTWALAGVLAGFAGLASSNVAARALHLAEAPFLAVAQLVIRVTPGPVVELAIATLGESDKTVLVVVMLVLLVVFFGLAGVLARRSWWQALVVYAVLGVLGAVAALSAPGGGGPAALVPVLVGATTWLVCLSGLAAPLLAGTREGVATWSGDSDPSRRSFLVRAGVVAGLALLGGVAGELLGRGRRQVEQARDLLKLPISRHPVPPRFHVDGAPEEITPWRTPNDDFYLIHTALVVPAVDPVEWRLRIHGMVEREITMDYEGLVSRPVEEAWLTLSCVSNEIGGDLVGNAWWSGVRVADLLAEAGVSTAADAVLQTSTDGWTCGTPLAALTDERDAMLAFGMNGLPLPVEHGFPVRTIVPGLYGYVSACKWVVDLEVTRFADITAYWTERGWAEQAPVKTASRIDVPDGGAEVPAGTVTLAGMAWDQHDGIRAVEVQLDGGGWQQARLGGVPSQDTWVQWAADLAVAPGEHRVRVRATNGHGETQTSVRTGVLPDGATGWHEIEFTALEET